MLQNKHVFQLLIIPLSTQSVEDASVGVGRTAWLHQSPMNPHVGPWVLPGEGMSAAESRSGVPQPAGSFPMALRDPLNRNCLMSSQTLFS